MIATYVSTDWSKGIYIYYKYVPILFFKTVEIPVTCKDRRNRPIGPQITSFHLYANIINMFSEIR